LAQAQPTHSHDSHEQSTPLQSGHLQTTQPHCDDLAIGCLAARAWQPDRSFTGAVAIANFEHPHDSHSHTSQVQPLPSHPTQVQAALDFVVTAEWPAKAKAKTDPNAAARASPNTKYRFICSLLQIPLK
jgi:hypothetical protein